MRELVYYVATSLDGRIAAPGSHFDTVVMGWNTYAAGFPHGVRDPYPHLRQYVVTRSHDDVPEGIEIVRDDPVGAVRRLKGEEAARAIWLCGGGSLAGVLLNEYRRRR